MIPDGLSSIGNFFVEILYTNDICKSEISALGFD